MGNKRAASPRSKKLRVRVKYRTEPDLQRIGRAVIEFALQTAATAAAKSDDNNAGSVSATDNSEAQS